MNEFHIQLMIYNEIGIRIMEPNVAIVGLFFRVRYDTVLVNKIRTQVAWSREAVCARILTTRAHLVKHGSHEARA